MNAGAYGSDWAAILERALVVSARRRAAGSRRPSSGSRTATRSSVPARSSRGSSTGSRPRPVDGDQGRGRRARRAAQGDAADEQADVRLGVQEPAGRARRRAHARALRAQGPSDRRRRHLAAPRELHRERGRRDERRLPRADGRGPPPRPRAVRRRARAGGRAPRARRPQGTDSVAANSLPWHTGDEPDATSGRVRARRASSSRSRARRPAIGLDLGPLVPSGRSLLLAFAVLGGVLLASSLARETSLFGVRRSRSTGANGAIERQVLRDARRPARARACSGSTSTRPGLAVAALPTVAAVSFDRAYPHTLRVTIVPERPVAVVRQGAAAFVVSEAGPRDRPGRASRPADARTHLGREGRPARARAASSRASSRPRSAPSRRSPASRFPSRVVSVDDDRRA